MNVNHRRPDIHVIDELAKTCIIVEVMVCLDLYLDYAYVTKWKKYKKLVDCLGKYYEVDLVVLCFGSLGSVRKDVWKHLKRFSSDKNLIKSIMKQCSISEIIESNYIWRHRVMLCSKDLPDFLKVSETFVGDVMSLMSGVNLEKGANQEIPWQNVYRYAINPISREIWCTIISSNAADMHCSTFWLCDVSCH